mmetsp:Transcript_55586/g.104579  ORF Transcript_55586/g.104579 Transcript_55586/m.104579 type:complete len:371 (-) Transcript_55586:287-1399(-)
MASCCMMLIFVQMFALMFVTGFCWESSVGNNDSDTSGSDEELDPTLVVLSEVIAAALFLFSLVLGALDYRWAPTDRKLAPTCQNPQGCGDLLLAVIFLPLKLMFAMFISCEVMASMVDSLTKFVVYIFLLGCATLLMCTLCLPVTWYCSPTWHEVRQQYKQEKKEINNNKMTYICDNFCNFLFCMLCTPCKLLFPTVFVTTVKALSLVVFADIFFGIAIWLYALFRIVLSACTYKVLTVKGWLQEIKDVMEIRRRVMALDYPVLELEGQNEKNDDFGDVKEVTQETGKKKAIAAASDTAAKNEIIQDVGDSLSACGLFSSLITICWAVLEDAAFCFLLQFAAAGFAVYIAEKVLEKTRLEQSNISQIAEP